MIRRSRGPDRWWLRYGWLLRTLTLVVLCGRLFPARAHRLDELLQATLVGIEPDAVRLELNLTPGVESFPVLLALLDLDHDRQISQVEGETYANRIRSELHLDLDGHPLALQAAGSQFPPLEELRAGLGTLRFMLRAELPPLVAGPHELRYQNRHLPDQSVYLVNAVRPQSPALQVTGQLRNTNQSECRLTFTRTSATSTTVSRGQPARTGRVGIVLGLAGLGVALGASWCWRQRLG